VTKDIIEKSEKDISVIIDENDLLSSYSSDTVYRLRYNDMCYDYISPSVTKLLGFTPEEIKKINFRSLISETRMVTDGLNTLSSFEELEKKRRHGDVGKWQADYLLRTKTGGSVWVSDISHSWLDKDGNIIGSVGSLRDISDRVLVEEKMRKKLEKLANTDSLTGISNRDVFFNELDKEIKRIQRSEEEAAILLIEIDNFRMINNKFGDSVSDEILVNVTKKIKSCLRETDLPARLDSYEFAVLLPDTPANGAYWVAERIRNSVFENECTVNGEKSSIRCSVSIGIASTSNGEEIYSSDLYKLADTRLYIAKHTGRNQVSIDEVLQTH